MAAEHYIYKTVNGDELKGFIWKADKAKANLVIVTGMEEHSFRYNDFALFMNKNGFNVVCVDHYGQGENVDNIADLGKVPASFFSKSVRNIDGIVSEQKANGLPTYLFAHSMGSFMAQDYIQRFAKNVDKVVICGTNGPNAKALFSLGATIAKIVTTKKNREKRAKLLEKLSIGAYVKAVKHRKTNCDWLSYNEANVHRYIEDPKCGGGSTNGFYREFLKGNARLFKKKFLAKISPDIHIFLIAGAEDPVGANGKGPSSLAKLYKKLGVKDVNLKIYQHMRHEILNEDDKQIVYDDILNFYNK